MGGDPQQEQRVLLLDTDGDIDDPIGMGQEAYNALAQRLMEVVPRRLKEVVSHEDRAGIGPSRG